MNSGRWFWRRGFWRGWFSRQGFSEPSAEARARRHEAKRLARQLQSKDASARRQALEKLPEVDDPLAARTLILFTSQDAQETCLRRDALETIRQRTPQRILSLCCDSNRRVRTEAIDLLRRKLGAACDLLLQELTGERSAVSKAADRAIREAAEQGFLPPLLKLASHSAAEVRCLAIRCLCRLNDPGAIAAIEAARRDPDQTVSAIASLGLKEQPTETALPALTDIFLANKQSRAHIREVLLRHIGKAPPELVRLEELRREDEAMLNDVLAEAVLHINRPLLRLALQHGGDVNPAARRPLGIVHYNCLRLDAQKHDLEQVLEIAADLIRAGANPHLPCRSAEPGTHLQQIESDAHHRLSTEEDGAGFVTDNPLVRDALSRLVEICWQSPLQQAWEAKRRLLREASATCDHSWRRRKKGWDRQPDQLMCVHCSAMLKDARGVYFPTAEEVLAGDQELAQWTSSVCIDTPYGPHYFRN